MLAVKPQRKKWCKTTEFAPLDMHDIDEFFATLRAEDLIAYKCNALSRYVDLYDVRLVKLLAIYAILTIRRSRREAVKLFKRVCALPYNVAQESIMDCLKKARAGLYDLKAAAIYSLLHKDMDTPFWIRQDNESWCDVQNRILSEKYKMDSIGEAKSGFLLEMLYQGQCEVMCIDSTLQRGYGFTTVHLKAKLKPNIAAMEVDFKARVAARGLRVQAVRWRFYDYVEDELTPDYWIIPVVDDMKTTKLL
jgi:hypothetical protein